MTPEQRAAVFTTLGTAFPTRTPIPVMQEMKTTRTNLSRDIATISGANVSSWSIVGETIIIKYWN